MATKNLRIGGVLRCCAATLNDYDDTESEIGEVLPCKYCDSSLILAEDSVWEWNMPPDIARALKATTNGR